jgi:hypothetical protein
MEDELKLWTELKQSPYSVAILVFAGVLGYVYFFPKSIEQKQEIYFIATLMFIGWCFERRTKVQSSELSDAQRDKLAAEWEREVKRTQRSLGEYMRLVSPQGRHWREWDERERLRFSEYFQGCELMWLSKLAHEFQMEDRRAWLRKRWECAQWANKDEVPIPNNPELWEMK